MTQFFRARLAASLLLFLPLIGSAATVTVNVSSPLAVMPDQGIGLNTATYENALCDATSHVVTQRLAAAGITAIRYPGGSYADAWNWAQNNINPGINAYYNANDTFDNFMKKVVNPSGAKAVITIDYGSDKFGTNGVATNDVAEAAAWVAYANVTNHWGVNYWEIGNEQAGNGYYGVQWETDLHVDKSPTAYGSNVVKFVAAMKAVDPTIKVGAAIVQPGEWPDAFESPPLPYNRSVLTNCGSVIDFVILHWYPVQTGDSASKVFSYPTTIPAYVQSVRTALTNYCGAARAGQIGIAITETDCGSNTAAVPALYIPDMYLTWFENGIFTVTWQEMYSGTPVNYGSMFLDNPPSPWTNHEACTPVYAASMSHLLANAGDSLVSSASSSGTLRVHASSRADGKVGIMFINQDSANSQTANVTVSGVNLASTGTWYQFGITNFTHLPSDPTPSYPISTNPASGFGNSFSVSIPAYTVAVLTIPVNTSSTNTATTLSSSANPSTYGNSVTFTATMTTNGFVPGDATGTVTFQDAGSTIGTGSVSGGQATLTTSTLSAGTHSITAIYSGDAHYGGSTSSALSQVINPQPVVLSGAKVYDGSINISAANLTIANLVGADSVTLSGAGTLPSKEAGSQAIATSTVSFATPALVDSSWAGYNAWGLYPWFNTPPNFGNAVICVVSTRNNTGNGFVNSVSFPDATGFTRIAQAVNTSGVTTEIWYNPSVYSTNNLLTVGFTNPNTNAVCIVAEYTNLVLSGALDQIAGATNTGTAAVTGTTPTTTQANELWIGGVGYANTNSLTSILNGFTDVMGQSSTSPASNGVNQVTLHLLQKMVTATGAASSGGTIGASQKWAGAIATFKAASLITSGLTLSGPAAANYTLTGATGTATVTAKPLNYTGISAANRAYDSTTNATFTGTAALLASEAAGSGSTSDGTPYTGDTVSISTGTLVGFFADKNVGTSKPVTLTSGLSLSGGQAADYSVGSSTTALTANILPPPVPTFLKPAISLGAGGWQLMFTGPAGQTYSILATSDLTAPLNTWNTLSSGTFGSGPISVTDSSTNGHAQFYLIVTP